MMKMMTKAVKRLAPPVCHCSTRVECERDHDSQQHDGDARCHAPAASPLELRFHASLFSLCHSLVQLFVAELRGFASGFD
jgi:hypothetical protein